MTYKVFFVEDEIVTREGIRDNVDWKGHGFEFSGEASDGEMALPLLQSARPDLLITDIKMPFMDGLQLSKIVRERMPWIKIIVLSGHDEFEYAQQAIGLGVTEYLLKPVTVNILHHTLQKIAAQLDRERAEQKNLIQLHEQLDENRSMLRDRLLQRLIVGAMSPTEAVENSQALGLDLVARCYLVMLLKTILGDRTEQFDYDEYQRVQHIVIGLVENNPDVFWLKKDWDELVLVMKGDTSECLEEDRDLLIAQIQQAVTQTRYQLAIGVGTTKKRIADISQSFVEALLSLSQVGGERVKDLDLSTNKAQWLKKNKSAVEDYLLCGIQSEFDGFFDAYLQPLGETAIESPLMKSYILMDVVVNAARLVHELGGTLEQVAPELISIETMLAHIQTVTQLRAQAQQILSRVLAFRDSQSNGQVKHLVKQAKEYISGHYRDPNLSLDEVAGQVNLSASHFSVVFSHETCQTFKEYLIEVRMRKAKELLRTTDHRTAEIAYAVGYADPHYFSSAFKKHTGQAPTEFRSKAHLK